jgi:hypothetical protein
MWKAITGAVSSLFGSWVELKKAKHQAQAARAMKDAQIEGDWDLEAQRQAQHSWKDEMITIVWFAPLVMAWFDEERAMKWVEFVQELPYWYQFGMFGIIAASFGLRWYFKQQNFKVGK